MQDQNLPAWLPQLDAQGGPRFLQIADALQAALLSGALKPGDRLPPQRQLAAQLALDLTTITRAYEEARRRHLLEGRGAHGTYVAAPKLDLQARLDLSMNTPPAPEGVDFHDVLQQGLAHVLMRSDKDWLMTYHQTGGSDAERQAGAHWLAPILGQLDSSTLLVAPGAQAALVALILALSEPGATILAEAQTYPGLRTAAGQFGRQLVAVASDQQGMLPASFDEACRLHRPALVYFNPTLQNPTSLTMPLERRAALLAIAKAHHVRVIEDDPYYLFATAPPPAMARLAPQQVCYISSLSKCLTPGLRLAYVVLPDAAERQRFLQALRSFALMSSPLTAALATQWILDGSAHSLMAGIRAEANLRQRLAAAILAGYYRGTGEGLHLWLDLPNYWQAAQFAEAAARAGIVVTAAAEFTIGGEPSNAIRIALGSSKQRAELQAGLQQLSLLLAQVPK